VQKTTSRTEHREAAGKAHRSEITVHARRGGKGWTITMQVDGKPADEVRYSKDAHGLSKHDWHEIDFHLDEPAGQLAFHPDKHQAIWVARGTPSKAPPCPDRPMRDHGVVPVSVSGRMLRVKNVNAERCLLSFRLNFIAAGSEDDEIVAFLDPIMNNQNGGSDN
jgi:hypothetical protein